jgi:hypothetical protein
MRHATRSASQVARRRFLAGAQSCPDVLTSFTSFALPAGVADGTEIFFKLTRGNGFVGDTLSGSAELVSLTFLPVRAPWLP